MRCKKCSGDEDVELTYCGAVHLGECTWQTVSVHLCIDCRIRFKTMLLETSGYGHLSENAIEFVEAVRK
jgi:hypothetical protein